jgi:hypothetical protein
VEYCSPAIIALDRSHFGVLAGDDRHFGAGRIANTLERRDDAARQAVIGRQHAVHLLVGVVGGEQVVHAGLGDSAVPAQRTDLVHAHLAGDDGDSPASIIGCSTDMAPS